MTSSQPVLTSTASWSKLSDHHKEVWANASSPLSVFSLFESDEKRAEKYSVLPTTGFLIDFSKNLTTDQTMNLLFNLAKERDVLGKAQRMAAGEKVNK